MTSRFETAILRYLSFQLSPSDHHGFLWQANEDQWRQALAFADTAGLTLFLRANLKRRGDFQRLLGSIQQGLEQRFQDNVVRTQAICQELIEFNRLLRAQNIHCLNLKGQVLYPDFVDQRENRLQYDHDFLIDAQDLEKAYALFLNLGYSRLSSNPKLAVSHLPTLVKKTGWEWKGNLYDPGIPRAVELHFQLWDSEFDKIPIRALDDAWRNSGLTAFQSVSVPVLSREQTLLYCVLHSFRHLLRNDLRLAHLYEIGFFVHRQSTNSSFWHRFLTSILSCPSSCRAVATIFELARRTFDAEPAPMVRQFMSEHLSPAAALWIERYGVQESIHCYRRSKSAVFLHLDFVEGLIEKSVVIGRKFIPRHLPVSSFGVQTPVEQQNRRFYSFKLVHDSSQLVRRALFHAVTLAGFLFQLPLWMAKVHLEAKKQRSEPGERYSSTRPSAKA